MSQYLGSQYSQNESVYQNDDFCIQLNCTGLELDPADCPKSKLNYPHPNSIAINFKLHSGFSFHNSTILKITHVKSEMASFYIEDSNIQKIE